MGFMKNICILGSTGSIGQSSLEVIAHFPDRFRVAYLTANTNTTLLQEQINRFNPVAVAVMDECAASVLKKITNGTTEVLTGEDGLLELIRRDNIDIVISALVGFAGLTPTIEAIKRGKIVALANKETLVVAGEIIMKLTKEYGATLVPIDSEHSAILQCLAGEDRQTIERLILTASGGPFLHHPKRLFDEITVEQALNHPNWKMGNKITIDSATLMNKGLEVIEAHWLFGLPPEKIDVVIHPQSIIHSMVEFYDGSVKAQLGVPDMKIPIQYAITYPERVESSFARINFSSLREMTFLPPDKEKFECLALAYEALSKGGTAPAILNAANEVAVDLFLNRKITFTDIPLLIGNALRSTTVIMSPTLDTIIETDRRTRETVRRHGNTLTTELLHASA